MSLEVTVVCDGCGEILGAAPYGAAGKARKDARDAGASAGLPGGHDLCRACAQTQEQPSRPAHQPADAARHAVA